MFKRESRATYLTLIPVVLGIVIASNFEPLFDLFGFLMCITSTSGRALKSVVQGMLLTSESEKLNSLNLLLYMAPVACLVLLPATLILEGNVAVLTFYKSQESLFIIPLLFANMTMAFSVNLFNFLVTKHTSPLTLQVLGNAKAAIAVFVSVLLFRNPVTVMGMVGFGITLIGVVLYNEARKRSKPR
ncbi:hypothetical protein CBR_g10803 [Chara braunii]|uniref:Sugar phosphate transporter domain-containing protein n=1 Tax=Chara braunii TaxID=69332 RepID=A0A388KPA6_CHABU|nr:hypothetical protein CBR_g10803 [Chara braunii]|eukprot:GBG71867.1 hypothetical protein CBR_g10803 [Chara braunii]